MRSDEVEMRAGAFDVAGCPESAAENARRDGPLHRSGAIGGAGTVVTGGVGPGATHGSKPAHGGKPAKRLPAAIR